MRNTVIKTENLNVLSDNLFGTVIQKTCCHRGLILLHRANTKLICDIIQRCLLYLHLCLHVSLQNMTRQSDTFTLTSVEIMEGPFAPLVLSNQPINQLNKLNNLRTSSLHIYIYRRPFDLFLNLKEKKIAVLGQHFMFLIFTHNLKHVVTSIVTVTICRQMLYQYFPRSHFVMISMNFPEKERKSRSGTDASEWFSR